MTPLRPNSHPLSRFALLLAALLHLLGAAAGPTVHARLAESTAAEQRSGDERERPTAPAHDERSCAVCGGHETPALPEDGWVLALAPAARDAAAPESHRSPPHRPADAPRARGPPHLS